MDWVHETRRFLYVREEGAFAALPAITRGIGALVIKVVDDAGELVLTPGETPGEAVCRLCRAHKSERAQVSRAVSALVEDGYLVVAGDVVAIRNYPAAQGVEPMSADERSDRRKAEALKKAVQRAKKKAAQGADVKADVPANVPGTRPGDKSGTCPGGQIQPRGCAPTDAPTRAGGSFPSGPSVPSEEQQQSGGGAEGLPYDAKHEAGIALLVAQRDTLGGLDDRELRPWGRELVEAVRLLVPSDASPAAYVGAALGKLRDQVSANPAMLPARRLTYLRTTATGLAAEDKPRGWPLGRAAPLDASGATVPKLRLTGSERY
jgi:hypothetical protein